MRDRHPGKGQVRLPQPCHIRGAQRPLSVGHPFQGNGEAVEFPNFFAEKRLLSIPCDICFSLSYDTQETVKPSCLALGLQLRALFPPPWMASLSPMHTTLAEAAAIPRVTSTETHNSRWAECTGHPPSRRALCPSDGQTPYCNLLCRSKKRGAAPAPRWGSV